MNALRCRLTSAEDFALSRNKLGGLLAPSQEVRMRSKKKVGDISVAPLSMQL